MPDNALYVYGIVKFGFDLDWREAGIEEKNVYTISESDFSALVHDCEEKPYISEDPNKIKELIIAHNKILDKAMLHFGGVIPLHFNTIIKKGENSSENNLKMWLYNDKERLERIWNMIKGRKEYGIRIYYDKEKLMQEASKKREIEAIEKSIEGKSEGLSYLLKSKAKSMLNEIVQNNINEFKKKIYNDIKMLVNDARVSTSRIFIDEEKDLLLTLSALDSELQTDEIKKMLEGKYGNIFSFQVAGPFAPYSFVQNEAQ